MNTVLRAKQALWRQSGLSHDSRGYLQDPNLNFVNGMPEEAKNAIQEDYRGGSGQEWASKFRAIHSSAALAANAFGRWKTDPASLTLLEKSEFKPPKLEAKCPSGLGGTPPNLDVLLQSKDGTVIGIESKLLEPLSLTTPEFSASYARNRLPLCEDHWWDLLNDVRTWGPSHLDAAQLVKHYLGLRRQYPDAPKVVLVYLFWKPLNAAAVTEYGLLTEDLNRFAKYACTTGAVEFHAIDYLQLWATWKQHALLAAYAKTLLDRYAVEI